MVRNPIYGFIAFLIVEALVSFGFLMPDQAGEARNQVEGIVFYAGLAITALLGFAKYIEAHKHQVTEEADKPVENKTEMTISSTRSPETNNPSNIPPLPSEENPPSNPPLLG